MRAELHTVGAYAAKAHFSELLERVAGGETVTITKHGTPVAQLVPVGNKSSEADRRSAILSIRELSKGISLGGLKIRDLLAEGRK